MMFRYRMENMMARRLIIDCCVAVLTATPVVAFGQSVSSFADAGQIQSANGVTSQVTLSGDGLALGGTSSNGQGFVSGVQSGQVSLGAQLGSTSSSITGLSFDGTVATGNYGSNRGFRYTAASGFTNLGTLNPSSNLAYTVANGISADGSVIVGSSVSTTVSLAGAPGLATHAYRWTAATGMVDITPGSGLNYAARAVSANGTTIVGTATIPDFGTFSQTSAFRWTAATGMTQLGALPAPGFPSFVVANAVDADGGVVVGMATTPTNALHAVRWDGLGAVATDLGTLGGASSQARGVNADGTVIVGTSLNATNQSAAFRWTPAGMSDLAGLLRSARVNLGTIALLSADAVSADGRVIAASGTVGGDPVPHAFLVTYGGPAAGITTPADLASSINQIRQGISRLMAGQHGVAAATMGDYQPLSSDTEAGLYTTAPYTQGGGFAQIGFGGGLDARLGTDDTQQRFGHASQADSLLETGAIRLVGAALEMAGVRLRPVAELGGWYAPNLALGFSRSYANGAGTAVGQGGTRGAMSYVEGRLAAAIAVTDADDLVLAGEFGREYLASAGWSEAVSDQNPFPASFAGIDTTLLLGKLRAQFTHRFLAHVDATLFLAGAHVMAGWGGAQASVLAIGPVTARVPDGTNWAEYGARAGYSVGRVTLDVFVGGIAGPTKAIASSVHAGAGLRVAF
jgi:probable HAF family extracellular repeat protein